MGAYLGVARGSETEPQFIHLTYTPPDGKVNKKVGIIGKGKGCRFELLLAATPSTDTVKTSNRRATV